MSHPSRLTLLDGDAAGAPNPTASPEPDPEGAEAAAARMVAAGEKINGAELGRQHGLSPRRGRDIANRARRDAQAAAAAVIPPAAAADGPPSPAGSRQEPNRRRAWPDTAITLVVALVAAAASYGHMHDVALAAGEPTWIARAWPITVDGLALAALRAGHAGRRWLALGLGVSVAANVVAQFPEVAQAWPAAVIIAGWPPLALYGTHRLLTRTDDVS